MSRPRRLVQWELGPGGDDIATLDRLDFTASGTSILGTGAIATEPITVVRTRGFISFQLTASAAALDGYNIAYGVGVVTADAFAIGVTAVPNPFDDIEWAGWLVHGMTALHSVTATVDENDMLLIEFDSKAQRKVGVNEVVFLAIQVGETGTAVMSARGASRMLIKLH